jgi:hypothetical protein
VFSTLDSTVTPVLPRVRRVDDKTWIAGIDELAGWGKGEENTFIGSLRASLAARGERVSYDRLMGVSGAAFRLQIARPRWCPSAPDATVGFDVSQTALGAFGYEASVHHTLTDDATPEQYRSSLAAVLESVENGQPAVAIGLGSDMDWGVITGYDDRAFVCRTYDNPEGDYVPAANWPCIVVIPTSTGREVDWEESFLESLRLAVRLARTPRFEQYASGFAAYEAWIRDLTKESSFANADEENLGYLMHCNAWMYYSLWDARAAAARYLSVERGDNVGLFGGFLSAAAEVYERIAGVLHEGKVYAPFSHRPDPRDWTQEHRCYQIEVLRHVMRIEEVAVALLQKATVAYDRPE